MKINKTGKYILTYGMKDVGEFGTFKDAFKDLHTRISQDAKTGIGMGFFATIWILEPGQYIPMMFDEIKDKAINDKLVINGKLNQSQFKKV